MPTRSQAQFRPRLGKWYESKGEVRSFYGEYRKGILMKDGRLAIIFNYVTARRIHYGDKLDHSVGAIKYIGEGKAGNQSLNARNKALIATVESGQKIDVYLDCGDIFKPKRLLYVGKWTASAFSYTSEDQVDGRKVYSFDLRPTSDDIILFLRYTFGAVGVNRGFETDLKRFAKARKRLYEEHANIMRSRDNIVGEIGEYYAIKLFNQISGFNHLIRLSSSFKDIDAVRVGNGQRFAIKTLGKIPSSTSSIWSKNIRDAVDYFLLCHIGSFTLQPDFVCQIAARDAQLFLRKDNYQGSYKLWINNDLLRESKFIYGRKSKWVNRG